MFYPDHLSRDGVIPAEYGDFFVVESTDSFNREWGVSHAAGKSWYG